MNSTNVKPIASYQQYFHEQLFDDYYNHVTPSPLESVYFLLLELLLFTEGDARFTCLLSWTLIPNISYDSSTMSLISFLYQITEDHFIKALLGDILEVNELN